MSTVKFNPCHKCGISGVHACLGVRQEMSKRQQAMLKQVIADVIKVIKANRQESGSD